MSANGVGATECMRRLCGFGTGLIGTAVLLGWLLDVAALKSVLPGLTTMKANSALSFLLGGTAILLLPPGMQEIQGISRRSRGKAGLATLLGLSTLLIGGITLIEYLSGTALGLDELLFFDPASTSAPFNGRMSPATAGGFIATGIATLLLAQSASSRNSADRSVLMAHLFALVPGSVGVLSLAGYAYDVKDLYRLGPFVAVALHSAVGFAMLGMALTLTMPQLGWRRGFERGSLAETVLLRLMLAALTIPFAAGGLVVCGAKLRWYDPLFAPALLALAAAGSAVGLAFYGAAAVRGAEARLTQANAALAFGEERLQIAQRAGQVGTFEWFPKTGRLDVSDEYRRILGLPRGLPVTADHLVGLVHADDRDRTGPDRLGNRANPLDYAEFRFTRPDTGEERWLARRGELVVDDGGHQHWMGVAFDITEQKHAMAALAESEAWFRTLITAMPQQMFITLPDGDNRFQNRRWQEFTGTPTAEHIAGGWLEVVHPDDREANVAGWTKALAQGTTFEIERRLRAANGSYHWFLTRAEPLRDETGAIAYWFGTSTDISEIVAARETSARSQAQLERLVEERTRDLQETQTRLAHAQRMEALGQLAGGIAHDFNNIMQSVLGAATLIDKRADDPARVRRFAQLIAEAATRGGAITRRLLTFARLGDLRAESVDPAALLTGMQEILTHTLGGSIPVRVELGAGLRPFSAVKGQLETVLVNLATNARDAMPRGGTLSLTASMDLVTEGEPGRLLALPAGSYVSIALTDSGLGMTDAVLARATEPFFTTKEVGKGTGLGLAMARGFAEQSGGGLLIASRLGQGTVVTIWLPVAADHPAPRLEIEVRDTLASGTRTRSHILVVDDDTIVRETLVQQMEEYGYTVIPAASGAEALHLLEADPAISLLLTDLSMPVMDGMALIRESQRRRPGLPALLLTGYATEAAELANGLNGPLILLRKPITGTTLAKHVAMTIEQVGAA